MKKMTAHCAALLATVFAGASSFNSALASSQELAPALHAEPSIKLPFDSPFCDLNDDQNISPDEMTSDNLCMLEAGGTLFSQKPIVSFNLKKGQLMLTLDDGPSPVVTPKILELLDQYNIKATFFVIGKQVPANREIVKQIIARGHTLANHTYSHNIPKITSDTIVDEITKAHKTMVETIGQEIPGRLLFRAPGLAWNSPKAIHLNGNALTRNYIGPIHANLGADAPRADWSCWSKGVPADTCAAYYFQDIVNAGRGVVLTHDIFYKAGRGNTYEMLKILLRKLDTEAGGIKNHREGGIWDFVTLENNPVLDQFEVSAKKPAPTADADQAQARALFAKPTINIRALSIENDTVLSADSLIMVKGAAIKTGDILAVAVLDKTVSVGGATFKQVRIDKARTGLAGLEGKLVYIWAGAF
jgi:peptidoglycan/xylan/chitin deacetylase (PgdA/CDA1 family)